MANTARIGDGKFGICTFVFRKKKKLILLNLPFIFQKNPQSRGRVIEDTLIKSVKFPLPGKKALLNSDIDFEMILIDASESPIERPKKK